MIINVGYALIGQELELQRDVSIEIEGHLITSIKRGFRDRGLTFKHGIAMPTLVNAHMHVLDYTFQEVGLDLEIGDLVSEPHGLKHKLISTLSEHDIRASTSRLFSRLVEQGVHQVVIFCERIEALKPLRDAAEALGLNAILLARPKRIGDTITLHGALEGADGLGLDSPLRYSVVELEVMRGMCSQRGLLKASHISETRGAHERGDLKLALEHFDPDMIVHGVHLEEDEIKELADKGISLVLCPRSNMWFSSGLPPLKLFLKHGINLLVGTDNAAWVNPDLWRELEVLYNLSRLQGLKLDPREILKIATVNAHRVKNMKVKNNVLEEGLEANFIVLDGEELDIMYSHNIYASIVKRASLKAVVHRVFSSPSRQRTL